MKKFISIMLILIMIFTLCACNSTPSAVPTEDSGTMKVGFIYLHDE